MKNIFKFILSSIAALAIFSSSAQADSIRIGTEGAYPPWNAKDESGKLIGFGQKFKIGKNYFNLSKKGNLKEAANNLYKTMRKIKKKKFESIAVIKIPNKGIGYAINDRLKKASNK